MSDLIIYFLPAFLGVAFTFLALEYENYSLGMLGGLTLLSYGVAVLINPIGTLSSLSNDVVGSILIGSGSYIIIAGNIEYIIQLLPFGSKQ